jgi:peroxiredoxin
LQKVYEQVQSKGAEVLAVSTDDLRGAGYSLSEFGLKFPVLYTTRDPSVPKEYGVFDLFGDGLASASVFIIDKDGRVVWKDIGANYTHQVAGKTVLDQLDKIAK